MDFLFVLLQLPMLVVVALGLPTIVLLFITAAKLFGKRAKVQKESTRKKLFTAGLLHILFGALPILLTPVSMITDISMYVCVFGAIVLALSAIVLGIRATRFRASHICGIVEIVFGVLFALLLIGFWAVMTYKIGIKIF